jgi:ferredoxin--NADP+ reductase
MTALADEIIICTDDGSKGRKALVTEPLGEICRRDPPPDLAVAIGSADYDEVLRRNHPSI